MEVQDMPMPHMVNYGTLLSAEPSGVHKVTLKLHDGKAKVFKVEPVACTTDGKYLWGMLPDQLRNPNTKIAQFVAWPPPDRAPSGLEGSCPVCGLGEVADHTCSVCKETFCPQCGGVLSSEQNGGVFPCSCAKQR